ncbi:GNAT family N-acetyltransferase [Caulobacter segnis]|uniref:GNAT family N-acetyltransferase n=1 Tax=Caulobacter segnis TaxID=88688 RepID=UPI00240F3602|nr:GNAT family N-acetyltransferase [Caulobacter segnis]MDG2522729.1 GNAT family N-acetyltransferase [Caulobacter segnis]
MNPTIRRATPADADALCAIGRDTFVETFGHLYPPQDLADYLSYAYGPTRIGADLADPAKAMWVVESADGVAVGYALAGPCDLPHDEVTSGCGELKRIYILKAHQGGGVGSRLMQTVFDWLEQPGRRLWIGVWSQNFGAQRFYERAGFAKVGEYIFPVGQTKDLEFILSRG